MSYLNLTEASQYIRNKTGLDIDAAALLRAGAHGALLLLASFDGRMRNLTAHADEDYSGLLTISPRCLLKMETEGHATIEGAISLDGKTTYAPHANRSVEQLRVLVSELDRTMSMWRSTTTNSDTEQTAAHSGATEKCDNADTTGMDAKGMIISGLAKLELEAMKIQEESGLSIEEAREVAKTRIKNILISGVPKEAASGIAVHKIKTRTTLNVTAPHALAEFRNMPRLSWNEVRIDIVAGESGSALLKVSARGEMRRVAMAEIDLVDRRKSEMNEQAGVLLALAQGGRLATTREMPRRVSRLRNTLKKHFGISSDPFETYNQQAGYKPVFEISDKRGAADERAKKNAERRTVSFEDWQANRNRSEDNDNGNDDDSNDDPHTRWFKENAPDMLEDDDLSR